MAALPPADGLLVLEQEAIRQRQTAEATQLLAACRSRLILGRDARSVFFAVLALRLKLTANWQCDTLETDGQSLDYNPAFVCGLSPDERLGVLLHEVMHNALAHPFRRGSRDPQTWNIACDLAVNPLLLDAGLQLPAGHLVPGQGRYARLSPGCSAEEYYAQLQESPEDSGTSSDPGGCGRVRDPEPMSGHCQPDEPEWSAAVVQAQQACSGRGELSSGLARLVETIVHPPCDWRAVLREFVSAQARNDYSWLRPNRRMLPHGFYLPSPHSEELGPIVIAVDTSGSVGERELAIFAGEIQAILEAFSCSVTVLYHDSRIQGEQHWHSQDGPLTLDPVGGGGTSHECVFDWLMNQDEQPACMICLTDLETRFPSSIPDVPTLWAVIGDNTSSPPFGQRVRIG